MAVRIAITGATGRMGQELLETAANRPDVVVGAATSQVPDTGPVAGYDLDAQSALKSVLTREDIEVLIDFTVPEATADIVEAAIATDTALVIGTTGYNEQGLTRLRNTADDVPVLKAANFARGVQALTALVREAAAALPEYDIELMETHHNGKLDAPSGTAKRLLREVEAAREQSTDGRTHGREGDAPREGDEIGVHAVRAGDVTGIHELLLAGNHEELRLTHRAEDRGVFAEGALDAAVWLAGREAGWYDFSEVLGSGGE